MYDDIRKILAWEGKPMGVPDASQWNPDTQYIRAIWQRVGGVWRTNKQAEVANNLGISLATLKRYMSKEGSCPYLAQFALESLAGMNKAGVMYRIEGSDILCRELFPFAAGGSGCQHAYIVLTTDEMEELYRLAVDRSLKITAVELISNANGR